MTILRFHLPFRFSGRLSETAQLQRCRLGECRAACCLHGVWMDPLEVEDLRCNAGQIAPFMMPDRRNPDLWFTRIREEEPAFPSGHVFQCAVLPNPSHYGGTECVFLRSDHKCALQAAADAAGLHPWRWKPFHCIIHPLTFDSEGRITLPDDEELLAEQGSCFRASEYPVLLSEMLKMELEFLVHASDTFPQESHK